MNYIKLTCDFLSDNSDLAYEIIVAELSEYGFESYENINNSVLAYIQEKDYMQEVVDKLNSLHYPDLIILNISTDIIQSQNWNIKWENNFNPVLINDQCIIRAPFHTCVPKVKYEIIIEPKMSFGTGHHETTFLMMNEIFKLHLKNKKVLDIGCGTGVLAILASKLKAKSIDAVDIDEWAIQNTIENCKINNSNNIKIIKGSVDDVIKNEYDVILANINLNVIIDSIPEYTILLKQGALLITSGFYSGDIKQISKVANECKLNIQSSLLKNKWAVCIYKKE